MAEKVKLGPIVGGFAIGSLALWLLLRKKKPVLPEPPENGVVVGLWNPPKEATMWTLTLTDWDMTVLIDFIGRDEKRLDIAEAAIFEIPDGLGFPLRVALLQLTKWNPEGTALLQLYSVQSIRELDPDYREVFIPSYGSYYYNVTKERFEK